VVVEVRQGLNSPPILYAADTATARDRAVFDPNPGLTSRFSLGHVEFIEWKNADGRDWEGRLYYPANYVPGRRYPLVIQTHGYADKTEFSLSGQGGVQGAPLGPTWSVFLAQPLASRGIAVLQIGGAKGGPRPYGEATEFDRIEEMAAAIQSAAEHIVEIGLADRTEVGLMGHSATGRVIEQALIESDFPYAAAIEADYADDNYLQAGLFGWDRAFGTSAPFAEGLKTWLEYSPAFNVERVRTPLQLEVYSSGQGYSTLLWPWEMFSRLKYLDKPVEFYVIPNISRGSHLLQNPRQLLALQNRAVDWWCFWLLKQEDAGRAEQFAEWRELRAKHVVDLGRPRPPRLHWVVSRR
jgi:hypothetical protein